MPPEVAELAGRVRAHLDRGDLTDDGPVAFGPGERFDRAELAALVVLADVAHCAWEERAHPRTFSLTRWGRLADQLRRLLPVDDR